MTSEGADSIEAAWARHASILTSAGVGSYTVRYAKAAARDLALAVLEECKTLSGLAATDQWDDAADFYKKLGIRIEALG